MHKNSNCRSYNTAQTFRILYQAEKSFILDHWSGWVIWYAFLGGARWAILGGKWRGTNDFFGYLKNCFFFFAPPNMSGSLQFEGRQSALLATIHPWFVFLPKKLDQKKFLKWKKKSILFLILNFWLNFCRRFDNFKYSYSLENDFKRWKDYC